MEAGRRSLMEEKLLTSWPAIDELSLGAWVKVREILGSSAANSSGNFEIVNVDGLECDR